MKCIACGREMVERETHYECSNILCDYEEERGNMEVRVRPSQEPPGIMVNNAARIFSFNY
jgi:hypothetical protein